MQALRHIGYRMLVEGNFESSAFSRIQKNGCNDSYGNGDLIGARLGPPIDVFSVGAYCLEAEPAKANYDVPIRHFAKPLSRI